MTGHLPTLTISHEQVSLPNQSFSLWLRGQTTLFISQIAAILSFVAFLASLIYYVSHLTGEGGFFLALPNIKVLVDYAHIVFIAIIILALIQVLDDNNRGSYHVKLVYERVFNDILDDEEHEKLLKGSKEQLQRFKRRFLWFWIVMLLLYVTFACHHSYQLSSSHLLHRSNTVVDGSATTGHRDLSPEHAPSGENTEPQPPSPSDTVKLNVFEVFETMGVPFLLFALNNISLLCVFWCFLIMYLPPEDREAKDPKFRRYSGLVMVGFTLLFPLFVYVNRENFTPVSRDAYIAVFDALSGTLNAIVLALLIARLDSKLIGLRSWLICVLYSYAAVQPMFVMFDQRRPVAGAITTAVLVFVFASKIYFFLIIIYALQTGRMLNYLSCFPVLRKQVNESKFLGSPAAPEHQSKKSDNKIMGYLDSLSDRLYAWAAGDSKRRLEEFRESLSSWMRSPRPREISWLLGIVATSTFFIFLIGYALTLGTATELTSYLTDNIAQGISIGVDIAHLIAVGGIIAALFLLRKDNGCHVDRVMAIAEKVFRLRRDSGPGTIETLDKSRYPPDKAEEQLQKFKEYFLWFWLVLFVLYVVSLSKHLSMNADSQDLNNIAASRTSFEILIYPFLQFALSTINSLFVFWCFVVLQSPAYEPRSGVRQRLLINYSGFVVVLLIAAFPLLLFFVAGSTFSEGKLLSYATVFEGLTGTLSGVALALLIARLDSKFISLSSSLICILFVYAGIQALSVVFNLPEPVFKTMATFVLIAALGLKICFFLIIAHTLQSGRMLNYLVCFPFLRERVDSIFENQFEIRTSRLGANLFTLSIFKKNHLLYSTGSTFENKRECDATVHELREGMKKREAYLRPAKESGTYWVEVKVKTFKEDIVCESIPLRSEEEANQLINESIDKIPYCKYNRA
jgi:hypothetical protein